MIIFLYIHTIYNKKQNKDIKLIKHEPQILIMYVREQLKK